MLVDGLRGAFALMPRHQRCPALQRLLADIGRGIVVYKIDRLTRSLADFARIVETLDRQGASFVSITPQFNTTTSMGRLTLNVLLVVRPVRTGGHGRAHPGQDRGVHGSC